MCTRRYKTKKCKGTKKQRWKTWEYWWNKSIRRHLVSRTRSKRRMTQARARRTLACLRRADCCCERVAREAGPPHYHRGETGREVKGCREKVCLLFLCTTKQSKLANFVSPSPEMCHSITLNKHSHWHSCLSTPPSEDPPSAIRIHHLTSPPNITTLHYPISHHHIISPIKTTNHTTLL